MKTVEQIDNAVVETLMFWESVNSGVGARDPWITGFIDALKDVHSFIHEAETEDGE